MNTREELKKEILREKTIRVPTDKIADLHARYGIEELWEEQARWMREEEKTRKADGGAYGTEDSEVIFEVREESEAVYSQTEPPDSEEIYGTAEEIEEYVPENFGNANEFAGGQVPLKEGNDFTDDGQVLPEERSDFAVGGQVLPEEGSDFAVGGNPLEGNEFAGGQVLSEERDKFADGQVLSEERNGFMGGHGSLKEENKFAEGQVFSEERNGFMEGQGPLEEENDFAVDQGPLEERNDLADGQIPARQEEEAYGAAEDSGMAYELEEEEISYTAEEESAASVSGEAGEAFETPGEAESTEQKEAGEKENSENHAAEAAGRTAPVKEGPLLPDHIRGFFRGFTRIEGLEQQIANAVFQAVANSGDRTSRTGNILIFGPHGSGKTTLAMNIAKAIAQDRGSDTLKVAKIYAADFNRKDIAATVAKIAGGTLIIEEAGDLDTNAIEQLTTAMEFRTDGMLVILEDEQQYIHDLLMSNPRFTMKFTAQIYLPVYTAQELVMFAQLYTGRQDYVISREGQEILYKKISAAAEQGNNVSIANVVELVNRAIRRSNKLLRKMAMGKKRYDENDFIILSAKDFR